MKFIGKIIGKIIIQKKNGKGAFVVFDFGTPKNPKYQVMLGNPSCDYNPDTNYPLGEMLKLINLEIKDSGKIEYNDLPEKIMDKARKEAILLNLK